MNLWSVPRSRFDRRVVEVARFSSDRSLFRFDESWNKSSPNLSFFLGRTFGPPKEDVLFDLVTFRLDLSSSRSDPKTLLPYFMWDVAFSYDRDLVTPAFRESRLGEKAEDAGRVRWFLERAGVAVLEEEFEVSEPDLSKCRAILAAEPRPGRLLLGDDELEVYASLGEPPPFLWLSFDNFFAWARERPGAHVFTTGG